MSGEVNRKGWKQREHGIETKEGKSQRGCLSTGKVKGEEGAVNTLIEKGRQPGSRHDTEKKKTEQSIYDKKT